MHNVGTVRSRAYFTSCANHKHVLGTQPESSIRWLFGVADFGVVDFSITCRHGRQVEYFVVDSPALLPPGLDF